VPVNGSYAAEITLGGCVDTTVCETIDYLSINEQTKFNLVLYPNPGTNHISIQGVIGDFKYTIHDGIGNVVSRNTSSLEAEINIKDLSPGIYFIRINQTATLKFSKL
jgi:hypothetical protein